MPLAACLEKFRIGCQVFEAQIHRSAHSPSAVDHPGGDNGALPRTEVQDLTTGHFDLELTLNDEKQLVRSWVFVPRILTTDYSKSETTGVHLAEYLIPVVFGHTRRFGNHIYDREWRMLNGFVHVRVNRWDGRGQLMPHDFNQGTTSVCLQNAWDKL
jgi:hypothetical protein